MPRVGLDRQKVLLAAIQLLQEEGFDAVTVHRLAKKLGVRAPSLYNHMDNIQVLQHQLAEYSYRHLYHHLHSITEQLETAEHRLIEVGKAYVLFAQENPTLYEAMVRVVPPYEGELQQWSDAIVELIIQLLDPFAFAQSEALHAVRGLRSILHGFATLEQSGSFGLALSLDESVEKTLAIFVHGLRASREEEGTIL